jgi:hypothetical protein
MPAFIPNTSVETLNLKFEQTVPRSLVHKRAIENVLLTEAISCGDDRFLCAGRIPTAHSFFNSGNRTPHNDVLFYAEMGRQASLAVSHAFLGVSRGEVFIFEQSKVNITEAASQSRLALPADCVVTEIKIHETQRRKNNSVTRVVAEHTMWIGDEEVFHGTGSWNMQPVALFQRLRRMGGMAAAPADQTIVRQAPAGQDRNAVISTPVYDVERGEYSTTLIVDETHPYFFDHPCDHVPGMLLLEGSAQLACAITAVDAGDCVVSAYEVNFAKFLETNIPTVLVARKSEAGIEVSISQREAVCGTTTLSVVSTR